MYIDNSFDLATSGSRFDILYLKENSSLNRVRISLLKNAGGSFYLQGRLEAPAALTFYTGTPGEIVKGQWYTIEFRYKGNDASTGGAELWLDGVSLGSNYVQNTSGLSVGRIEIGGNTSSQINPTSGSKLYFDDIKIATSSIGAFSPQGNSWIYTAAGVNWNVRQVMVDGEVIRSADSINTLEAGSFFRNPANNLLYVWLNDDANPNNALVEVGRYNAAFTITDQSYIDISGLAFVANNNTSFGGLTLINAENVVISSSTFKNNYGSGINIQMGSNFNTIRSSFFEANDRDFGGGIRIETDSNDNIIEYNEMSGLIAGVRSGNGINIRGSSASSSRNIVRYNSIHDMRDSGVYITSNANNNEVYGNVIHEIDDHSGGSSGGNGIHIANISATSTFSSGNKIFNNLIYDVGTHGITLREGTNNNLVYNNTIYNTGVNRGSVSGNVASGSGIDLHSSSDTIATGASNNRVFNNLVSTCATVCLNVDSYSVTAGGNEFDNNLYFQPSGNLIKWENTTYTDLSAYQTAAAQDLHSVSLDPKFTNTGLNKYTLQNNSPAINAGTITLGAAYRMALSDSSSIPTILGLTDQDTFGDSWEIGAFVYKNNVTSTPSSSSSGGGRRSTQKTLVVTAVPSSTAQIAIPLPISTTTLGQSLPSILAQLEVFAATPLQRDLPSLLARIDFLRFALAVLVKSNQSSTHQNQTSLVLSQNLTLGSQGAAVKQLQVWLNSNGYQIANAGAGAPLNETTYFGLKTKAALTRLQLSVGIEPAYGYCGPKTRAYLNSL